MYLKSKRELSGSKNKADSLSVFEIFDSFKKVAMCEKTN